MVDIFKQLNENQKEAVLTTEGYIRIIAGAGSGKTKTLVNRYAYLVNVLGVNPANILCVTFTNKAAQEMKKRVKQMVTAENVGEYICTYHGFCVKILRQDINKLNYPSSFIIMDEDDQKSLLKEIYEELNLTSSDCSYRNMIKDIKVYKYTYQKHYISNYVLSADNKTLANDINSENNIKRKCVLKYILKQKKGYYLDFEDLMYFTCYIFNNNLDIAQKWQKRLDYIMVDEVQDNSTTQWGLVSVLQEYYKNLLVVGDPDQCIYEWRGASPDALVRFDSKFLPCKTIILNENYRSTPNILSVANTIIANNKLRIEKDLYSRRQELSNVTHFHGENEYEEGEFIAQTIIKHINEGTAKSDIAVLYRASYLSRFIEQALIRNKLTYVVYGGIRFFERREIKDTLSYLRMVDSADDLSFRRTINLPSRKLGKVFLSNLSELAKKENKSLYNTLKLHINNLEFGREGAKEYISIIEEARNLASSYTISNLMQYLLDSTNLTEVYRREGDEERLENVQELLDTMQMYEEENKNEEDFGLNKYLQDVALYTNLDYKQGGDNVKIMTIHQSKGLEFPVIFVAGMYESIFPNERTIKERRKKGLEEERRLAYVAITRAENQLYLTESEGYNVQNNCQKYPSRFIFEIGSKFLIREGVLTKELEDDARAFIQSIDDTLLEEKINLEVNQLIEHKVFGKGEVIEVDNENDSVTIKFTDIEKPRHFSISRIAQNLITEQTGDCE